MLEIYAHYDSSAGTISGKNALHLLDTVDVSLDEAIANLLNTFWEEEAPANNGFIITSEEGKTRATLTPIAHAGSCDGIVEIYTPYGPQSSLYRVKVKYILDESGGYDHTEVTPQQNFL